MNKYIKCKIWRIRDLNDKYFEVLLSKESLNVIPGGIVTFYNSCLPGVLIASGIQEAWLRLIMNRDIYGDYFKDKPSTIKIDSAVTNVLPGLYNEDFPAFIITSEGCGALFSYVSTFPKNKYNVCYLGDNKVQEGWINQYQNLKTLKQMQNSSPVYLIGNQNVLKTAADTVSGVKGVYYCV